MKQILNYFIPISIIIFVVLAQNACVHDAIMGMDLDLDPIDTIDTIDTMIGDTLVIDTMMNDTSTNSMPCVPDVVYFNRDILPILNSNCALSGCHDVQTAEDDIILTSYESLLASDIIIPFDLLKSELYEAITEDDDDDIMPPSGRLPNETIELISKWILQGADTLSCTPDMGGCETEEVTYSSFVKGVISTNCNGCHASNVALGGIILDNYTALKNLVDSGSFYGAIAWQSGFQKMPQNLDQLDDCTLIKIKKWIDEGAVNN